MRRQTRKLLLNIATGVAVATTAAVILLPAAQAAPATVTSNVNVRSGPGANYPVIDAVRRGQTVDVRQCQANYCEIRSRDSRGWVSSNYLAQGGQQQQPQPAAPGFGINIGPNGVTINPGITPPGPGPRPPVADNDDDVAQVCFYERSNFRGASTCVAQGDRLRDFGRLSEEISSIDNPDRLSVQVCGADGDCRTYRSSASTLGDFDDYIVSARVR